MRYGHFVGFEVVIYFARTVIVPDDLIVAMQELAQLKCTLEGIFTMISSRISAQHASRLSKEFDLNSQIASFVSFQHKWFVCISLICVSLGPRPRSMFQIAFDEGCV